MRGRAAPARPAEDTADDEEPRCPCCGSPDYGPVDLAWPFGRPEHNPNPRVSLVVQVCLEDCGYVEGDEDE